MNVVMEKPVVLAASTTGNMRSNAVDIMKGIAISLMTFSHTSQGMFNRGWWGGPRYFFSYDFIYSFHMPVFFFAAGLFVMGSLERRGVRKFTLEKVKTPSKKVRHRGSEDWPRSSMLTPRRMSSQSTIIRAR